jgi:uncharacterized protein
MLVPLLAAALAVAPAAPTEPPREVTVTGDAALKVAPDQVIFTATVVTLDKDLNAAKRINDEKVRKVLLALTSAGVAERHVQTSDSSVNPQYRYDKEEAILLGYQATKTLTVCVVDLARVDETMSGALRAGARELSAVQLINSQIEKYEAEARVAAAISARKRAASMVEALGQKLGRPRSVAEQAPQVVAGAFGGYTQAPAGRGAGSTSFAGGELTVLARVEVKFDIVD